MVVAPLLATLVAASLTAQLARTAHRSRSPALAVWSLALAQFAVGSGALAWGVGLGWTGAVYRTFYLFGAVLNVAWLGLGTIWLLEPRRLAPAISAVLLAASVAVGLALASARLLPTAELALAASVPDAGMVVPEGFRELSRWFSIGGSVVVLGGLVWSLFRRRQRALGLSLIAAGIVVAGVGSALGRGGIVIGLSAGLAAGVVLMYAGFVAAQSRRWR